MQVIHRQLNSYSFKDKTRDNTSQWFDTQKPQQKERLFNFLTLWRGLIHVICALGMRVIQNREVIGEGC